MRKQKPVLVLGQIVATPPALALLARLNVNPASLLARHVNGDWGDLDAEDKAANDHALVPGNEGRILSSYRVGPVREKVWILTEWDRSATTILLPSDY